MPKLKKYLNRFIHLDQYLTHTPIFSVKCLIATLCLSYLLSSYLPKYEFLDNQHRCNKVTGKVEYYNTASYCQGWRE